MNIDISSLRAKAAAAKEEQQRRRVEEAQRSAEQLEQIRQKALADEQARATAIIAEAPKRVHALLENTASEGGHEARFNCSARSYRCNKEDTDGLFSHVHKIACMTDEAQAIWAYAQTIPGAKVVFYREVVCSSKHEHSNACVRHWISIKF